MTQSGFRIEHYTTVAEFLRDAGPWLLANEVDNWQPLNAAYVLAGDQHPFRPPYYLASVKAGERTVGCAIRPPPDQLDLTTMPSGAAALLVDGVAEMYADLPNVAGPPDMALEFAGAWTKARGGRWQVRHSWSLLALETVRRPALVPGKLRAADEGDWPTVSEWAEPFARATNAHIDVAAFLQRRMRARTLYVWDHGGPKCMVSLSTRTPTSMNVSGVYTPDAFRGRGYAANAVAAASQLALDGGRKSCTMFAEREPAVAIRVYQRVGYRPQRDHLLIDLVG